MSDNRSGGPGAQAYKYFTGTLPLASETLHPAMTYSSLPSIDSIRSSRSLHPILERSPKQYHRILDEDTLAHSPPVELEVELEYYRPSRTSANYSASGPYGFSESRVAKQSDRHDARKRRPTSHTAVPDASSRSQRSSVSSDPSRWSTAVQVDGEIVDEHFLGDYTSLSTSIPMRRPYTTVAQVRRPQGIAKRPGMPRIDRNKPLPPTPISPSRSPFDITEKQPVSVDTTRLCGREEALPPEPSPIDYARLVLPGLSSLVGMRESVVLEMYQAVSWHSVLWLPSF